MKDVNFWELLRSCGPHLTKSGRIVAEYLTQHGEEAQYLSISTLARACGVAEATIFRFCRALGFDGYNEMKISLAQANVGPGPAISHQLEPGMDTADLCEHSSAAAIDAISGTRAVLDPHAVDQAAALLQRARQVFCFGQGGSMVLATDIWARLATISTKFRTVSDSHMQIITASLLGPEDVVLFVSYSGATRDMMDTLRVARQSGAHVILLTHYADCPGASLSDVVLLCGAEESPLDPGSIPVKIAVLYVADVLVLRFRLDNQELCSLSRERTSKALATKLL
ncbi:MAG: MurR/RpiR family transcriptional regulator [Gemmiger sp.]|nr:MurR/RpiR family transcriptional regulator [Gemmiger sp.]